MPAEVEDETEVEMKEEEAHNADPDAIEWDVGAYEEGLGGEAFDFDAPDAEPPLLPPPDLPRRSPSHDAEDAPLAPPSSPVPEPPLNGPSDKARGKQRQISPRTSDNDDAPSSGDDAGSSGNDDDDDDDDQDGRAAKRVRFADSDEELQHVLQHAGHLLQRSPTSRHFVVALPAPQALRTPVALSQPLTSSPT